MIDENRARDLMRKMFIIAQAVGQSKDLLVAISVTDPMDGVAINDTQELNELVNSVFAMDESRVVFREISTGLWPFYNLGYVDIVLEYDRPAFEIISDYLCSDFVESVMTILRADLLELEGYENES